MTEPAPPFFTLTDAAIGDPSVPVATRPDAVLGETFCRSCGRRRTPIVEIRSCEIERGTEWVDIIGIKSWSVFLVSQRVVDGLNDLGATGFDASPVQIRSVHSRRLRVLPEPQYFFLDITGKINIDLHTGGIGAVERCPECFVQRTPGQELPTRYAPVLASWDGSDLLRMRNYPNQQTFCSRRVLEVAHRDRWTNSRFDPMDINRRHFTEWSGIDYLGARWPPAKWYPAAPSAGKPLEEWLEQMRSPDREAARLARIAVTDLGALAVPALSVLLDDVSEDLRRHAARMLYFVNQQHPLAEELKNRVLPLLPSELSSVWLRAKA